MAFFRYHGSLRRAVSYECIWAHHCRARLSISGIDIQPVCDSEATGPLVNKLLRTGSSYARFEIFSLPESLHLDTRIDLQTDMSADMTTFPHESSGTHTATDRERNSMHLQPACPLFRLPQELRDFVYAEALHVPGGYLYDAQHRKLILADSGGNIDSSLVQTCRRIRGEA